MAEQERKTKAERREEKRQRRMEEEAAAAEAAKRNKVRNGAIALTLVLVLGGLGYLAVGNLTPTLENGIAVAQADVEAAREASSCEVLEVEQIESRQHLTPATAPPEDALYVAGRPTASGPHYETAGPIFSGVRDEQLDERATTHNMEHGSVIVWFDPEQVSDEDRDEIDDMVATLNDAGFASNAGRSGILASPFTEPGIDAGKAVAIRSWGQAMDCDSWDIDYAYGWIIENFGSRGPAPEAAIGRYPVDVLEYSDEAATDEATTDDEDTSEEDVVEPEDDADADEEDVVEPADDADADAEG